MALKHLQKGAPEHRARNTPRVQQGWELLSQQGKKNFFFILSTVNVFFLGSALFLIIFSKMESLGKGLLWGLGESV